MGYTLLGLVIIAAIVWLLIWAVRVVSPNSRGWLQALVVVACFVIPLAAVGLIAVAVFQTVRARRRTA
jgi:hypothetical protein